MVFTNGTILERMTHSELLALEHTTIVVSVDGYDRDDYAAIRVGGDYDRLRENIKLLYEHRNANEERFPVIVVQHVVFPGDTSRQLAGFRRNWSHITDMVDFCIYNPLIAPSEPVEQTFLRRCKRIRREFSVMYDGTVPVCGPQSKHGGHDKVGNVSEQSISEMWNGHRMNTVRSCHDNRDLGSEPFCKSCVYFR